MNERQAFALANPLNDTTDIELIMQLSDLTTLPGGNLLGTVLAVDR
jgi:hypothetical protein